MKQLVQQAREDATQFKRVVDARERDLRALQDAYKKLEASHSRQGESNIHARSSLALEVDRLRRDMARSEQDLAAARRELEDKAARLKEEELNAMTLASALWRCSRKVLIRAALFSNPRTKIWQHSSQVRLRLALH